LLFTFSVRFFQMFNTARFFTLIFLATGLRSWTRTRCMTRVICTCVFECHNQIGTNFIWWLCGLRRAFKTRWCDGLKTCHGNHIKLEIENKNVFVKYVFFYSSYSLIRISIYHLNIITLKKRYQIYTIAFYHSPPHTTSFL